MKERIVFLDVDGVLNTNWSNTGERFDPRILPSSATILQALLSRSGAKIVVSSSWRRVVNDGTMKLGGFTLMLKTHGVSAANVIGALANRNPAVDHIEDRRHQMSLWRESMPDASFVALDDLPIPVPFLVRVDPTFGIGWPHVEEALRVFRNQEEDEDNAG
jgi:hypothetical protein